MAQGLAQLHWAAQATSSCYVLHMLCMWAGSPPTQQVCRQPRLGSGHIAKVNSSPVTQTDERWSICELPSQAAWSSKFSQHPAEHLRHAADL